MIFCIAVVWNFYCNGGYLWNMSFKHAFKKKGKRLRRCFLYATECGVHVDGNKIRVCRKQHTNLTASMIMQAILFPGWEHIFFTAAFCHFKCKILHWKYHGSDCRGCKGKSVRIGATCPKPSQAVSSHTGY